MKNFNAYIENFYTYLFSRMESRVRHLQGERWDYKGYFYQPVSSSWVCFFKYFFN